MGQRANECIDASGASAVDVGMVVALPEEFGVLVEQLQYESREFASENLVFYFFTAPQGAPSDQGYHCVATFVGEMGPTSAAVAAERLLHLFSPITIVNIGICGTMSRDARIGDVIVGDVIDEYICAAKASADSSNDNIPLRLSGRPYTTTPDYLLKCDHIQWTKPQRFNAWRSSCESRVQQLVNDHAAASKMLAVGTLRSTPCVQRGHIASGPIVSGASAYKDFLLGSRDRKYIAVEMEAAGVMAAAAGRKTQTLVIRGVSDLADEAKPEDDKAGCEGALRHLAMKNAVEFLWMLMDLNILYYGADETVPGEVVPSGNGIGSTDVAKLTQPDYEINFRYLPDAIQLHGWTIGVRTPETAPPQIERLADPDVGIALSIVAPLGARLDYAAPEVIGEYKRVELVFVECGAYAFYIRLAVSKEGATRSVWLHIVQTNAGSGLHRTRESERYYETEPTAGPGGWKIVSVDLPKAVAATFGTTGWELASLIGFRIRGTVRLARIGLYV